MSGGFFDGKEFWLQEIAEQLEELVQKNDDDPEQGISSGYKLPGDVLNVMSITAKELYISAIRVRHLDLLISGDTGFELFWKRMEEDLAEWIKK